MGRHAELVRAGGADDALELHVIVVAGAKRADAPRDGAVLGVEHLAFARAGQLHALGQRDHDRHVVGRRRARVAHPEEVRGRGAGVFAFGAAPVDLQLRLAAEDFLGGVGRQAAVGRGQGLDVQLARLAGGEFHFNALARARRKVAELVGGDGVFAAAGR